LETDVQASVRRLVVLSGGAALLGLIGGGAAWVLIHLIALVTNALFFHRFAWRTLPSFADYHPGPDLFVIAVAGGLVVALLAKWSPVIRGHGIPEAMEAVLTTQSPSHPGPRWPSRCPRRSPSAPVARSARRAPSS
jgi:H+/Cl- antiporter ClcA